MGDYEVVLPCVSTAAKDGAQTSPLPAGHQELAGKRPLRRTDSMPLELDSKTQQNGGQRRPSHLDLTPPDPIDDGQRSSNADATAGCRQPARAHQPLHRLLGPPAEADERLASVDQAPTVQPRLRRSVGTDFAKDSFCMSGVKPIDGEAAAALVGVGADAGAMPVAASAAAVESYGEDSDEYSADVNDEDNNEDRDDDDEDDEEEYLTETRRALGGGARVAVGGAAGHPAATVSDWSPATDLSPIEDVSPTIELEAEADWLAYQTREHRRPLAFSGTGADGAVTVASETSDEAVVTAIVCAEINNNSMSLSCVKLVDSPAAADASESPQPPPLSLAADGVADQRRSPCLETQSTTESGYESQSMGRVSDLISFFDRKSLDESKATLDCGGGGGGDADDDGCFGAANAVAVAAFGESAFCTPAAAAAAAAAENYECRDVEIVDIDYDDDRVPDVPDGVTYNIYAGRDMFRSSAAHDCERRQAATETEPPRTVPDEGPHPSEVRRLRIDAKVSALLPTDAVEAAPSNRRIDPAVGPDGNPRSPYVGRCNEQLQYYQQHQLDADFSSPFLHSDGAFLDHRRGTDFGTEQGLMPETAGADKRCRGKNDCVPPIETEATAVVVPLRASPTSPGSDGNRKPPVPLPRLSKLRSFDSDDSFSVAESDDELIAAAAVTAAAEARRLGGGSSAVATASGMLDANSKGRLIRTRSSEADESHRSPLMAHRSGGAKQHLAKDSDTLQQRAADKQEIALDLERQLAEIRRLEERQRAVLQRTLMSVVRSAQESSQSGAATAPMPESPRAGSRTLATPAGAVCSVALAGGQPRLSPQSPRKVGCRSGSGVSTSGGGGTSSNIGSGLRPEANFKFSPISENGDYNFRDWAGSPATLHRRTLSNHSLISDGGAPPPPPSPLTGSYSCLVRTSSDILQRQTLPPRSDGCGEALANARYRLSASYTELQQQQQHASWSLSSSRDSPDLGSGYFSDRECERRKAQPTPYAVPASDETALQMAFLQNEIERRQRQLEENIRLRDELQQLCRLAVLPRDQYERARDLYRDHLTFSGSSRGRSVSGDLCAPATVPLGHSARIASDRAAAFATSSTSVERLSGQASAPDAVNVAPPPLLGNQEATPPARNRARAIAPALAAPMSRVSRGDADVECAVRLTSTEVVDAPASQLSLRSSTTPRSRPASIVSEGSPKAGNAGEEASPLPCDALGGAQSGCLSAGTTSDVTSATAAVHQPPTVTTTVPKIQRKRWNFATKRILVIPKQNKGPCIEIAGGLPVHCGDDDKEPSSPDHVGAFVKNILSDSIESQLHGELKQGDEILEWNGVSLRDQTNDSVQDIISSFSSEIEMVVKECSPRRNTPVGEERHCGHTSQRDSCLRSHVYHRRGGLQRSPSGSRPQAAQPPTTVAATKTCDALTDAAADSTVASAKPSARRTGVAATLADKVGGTIPVAGAAAAPADSAPASTHTKHNATPSGSEAANRAPVAAASVARGSAATKPTKSAAGKGAEAAGMAKTPQASAARATASLQSSSPAAAATSARNASAPAANDSSAASADKQLPRSPFTSANKVANGGAPCSGVGGSEHRGTASGEARRHPATSSLPATPLPDRKTLPLKKLIDCGELHAAFSYDQSRQLLTTRVESADGLVVVGKEAINPFVKIHFIRNEKIEEKRCTRYMEKTSCPAWKQLFTFGVAESELAHYKVRLSAWDYHLPKQNLFIGSALAQLSDPAILDGSLRTYKLDCGTTERRRAESAKSSPTATSPGATSAAGASAPHTRSVRFTSDSAATAPLRPQQQQQQQRPAAAAAAAAAAGVPRNQE